MRILWYNKGMKILWTDGSANPNPGPGGYAVVEESAEGKLRPVVLGKEEKSSNIRMEGAAIGAAIKYAGEEGCEIHTDSEFWKKVLEEWAPKWKEFGWHKKGGPIKNLELVQAVYKYYVEYRPKLIWTRGHVGTKGNEMADKLANKARKGLTVKEWEKENL